jgi:diguanylate cyclase (GGDEF)-like protein
MTFKVKEKPGAVNPGDENPVWAFILDLQSAVEIEQLWRIFLERFRVGLQREVTHAELVYRGGVLAETIVLDKKKNEMSRKTILPQSFPYPGREFDYQRTGKKVMMIKQVEDYCIRLELKFAKALTGSRRENESLAWLHIFFNQLFLLLRIKNFELHSIKDSITLAYNQNYLRAFIQNEIERSRRYAAAFSVVFFDLDNLKAINESHGHLIGTEVLKEVAEVLKSQVRRMDLLSRFGGDEFVIVLLHVEAQRAYDVCKRIKTALKNTLFLKDKNFVVEISGCFGISSFPENGNTVDELIRKADIAMYEVKRTGKDGIKIYEGDR